MAAPACEPHPPRRGGGVGEVRGHLFTRVSGSGPRASWVLSLLGWGGGGGGGGPPSSSCFVPQPPSWLLLSGVD